MRHPAKPAKRNPVWKKRQRVLLFSLLALLLALAILIGGVYGFSEWQAGKLNAQLRAQGIPVTVEEYFQAHPKPPLDQNAAPIYLQIVGEAQRAQWINSDQLQKEIDATPLAAALDEDLQRRIDAHLAEHQYILAAMYRAAQYPACDFGLAPLHVDLPFLAPLRFGTALLHMHALAAAQKGDAQTSFDAVSAALLSGRNMQHDPHLQVHAQRIEINQRTLLTLQRVLSKVAFTEPQRLQLQTMLRDSNDPSLLHTMLIGERIACIDEFNTPGRLIRRNENRLNADVLEYIPGKIDTLIHAANLSGWNRWDRVWFMRIMNEMIDAARLPWPALLDEKDSIRRKAWQKSKFPPRISYALISSLARDIELFAVDTAVLRLGETALALERFQLANGHLPQQLADLIPPFLDAIPLDPFDGHPLRYRRTEHGYTLYSISQNRCDDNAASPRPEMDRFEGDIVFPIVKK